MVTHQIALGPEFDFLADDTEESLLGSTIHQDAIVAAQDSLRRHSRRQGLSWYVGNQLTMIIPREGGRPPYQPVPDLLVHTTLGDPRPQSLAVAQVGPPALVLEVASPSTARAHDVDTINPRAKPQVYAACGIAEYLVFDALGEILGEQVRAWHLDPAAIGPGRRYVRWLPDERGHWVSANLGVSFAPQGLLLRVYDAAGRLIQYSAELDGEIEARDRELALRDRELTARDRELIARDRELAELRAELRRLRGE